MYSPKTPKTYFLVSVSAQWRGNYLFQPVHDFYVIASISLEWARLAGLKIAKETWPIANGYTYHSAAASIASEDDIQNAQAQSRLYE